jgi:hypothetical protein
VRRLGVVLGSIFDGRRVEVCGEEVVGWDGARRDVTTTIWRLDIDLLHISDGVMGN